MNEKIIDCKNINRVCEKCNGFIDGCNCEKTHKNIVQGLCEECDQSKFQKNSSEMNNRRHAENMKDVFNTFISYPQPKLKHLFDTLNVTAMLKMDEERLNRLKNQIYLEFKDQCAMMFEGIKSLQEEENLDERMIRLRDVKVKDCSAFNLIDLEHKGLKSKWKKNKQTNK